MTRRLLVFETHPIQYRAPIFQTMQRLAPDSFEVIYASDFSVRGYKDDGFGASFAWDIPLLSGYPHRVLGNETARRVDHWSGLTATGVDKLVGEVRPSAVLLSSMSYAFNWAAYWGALRRGIPVWIRMETQDEATERSVLKGLARGPIYRAMYAGVSKAFYIGQLSREHLLKHGLPARRLVAAHYCTPNPFAEWDALMREARRDELRGALGIPHDHTVVSFFGKLIPKKDPLLILQALDGLEASDARKLTVLIVGSGELEAEMRSRAAALQLQSGIRSVFAGFINQSKLPDYYLASDIVALPSRRMGETWGLVVNEALHAGCSAVVSDAVGCHRDFGGWERIRVVAVGDAHALGRAVVELAAKPRDPAWADKLMRNYSIEASAEAIVSAWRAQ